MRGIKEKDKKANERDQISGLRWKDKKEESERVNKEKDENGIHFRLVAVYTLDCNRNCSLGFASTDPCSCLSNPREIVCQ